jgi:hypothetical protein
MEEMAQRSSLLGFTKIPASSAYREMRQWLVLERMGLIMPN